MGKGNQYLALPSGRLMPGVLGTTHLCLPRTLLSSLPGTQNTELGGGLGIMQL